MFADVRRGLAIAAVVEAATVTDTAAITVDTSEFFGKRGQPDEAGEASEQAGARADEESEESEEAEELEAPRRLRGRGPMTAS